jgi:hypothetical protein
MNIVSAIDKSTAINHQQVQASNLKLNGTSQTNHAFRKSLLSTFCTRAGMLYVLATARHRGILTSYARSGLYEISTQFALWFLIWRCNTRKCCVQA